MLTTSIDAIGSDSQPIPPPAACLVAGNRASRHVTGRTAGWVGCALVGDTTRNEAKLELGIRRAGIK